MRMRLDGERCVGHALCAVVDPALFPIDDAGYSTLQDGAVEPHDEVTARRGVEACPERALLLIDDGG